MNKTLISAPSMTSATFSEKLQQIRKPLIATGAISQALQTICVNLRRILHEQEIDLKKVGADEWMMHVNGCYAATRSIEMSVYALDYFIVKTDDFFAEYPSSLKSDPEFVGEFFLQLQGVLASIHAIQESVKWLCKHWGAIVCRESYVQVEDPTHTLARQLRNQYLAHATDQDKSRGKKRDKRIYTASEINGFMFKADEHEIVVMGRLYGTAIYEEEEFNLLEMVHKIASASEHALRNIMGAIYGDHPWEAKD